MAINTKKVLFGGIAAAVVLNLIDWVTYGKVLTARMAAETDAFKPGLSASMMSGNAITVYVITDIVFGILLVWTYAAMRPRFGAGPGTAIRVGALFWILWALFSASFLIMGMESMGLYLTTLCIGLVNFLIASVVGAMIYTEDGGAAAA